MQTSRKIQPIMRRKLNQLKLTQMLELADEDIKTVITTVSHMFKKLEEKLNMLSSDGKDIKI